MCCRYVAWIFIAALYHLPSFQSMGVDMRMNLSLFLTIYVSSVLFLIAFHIVFLGLWYVGIVARVAGRRPAILKIIQNCTVSFSGKEVIHEFSVCRLVLWFWITGHSGHSGWFYLQVISIACCVFYSHCGNRAILREKSFDRRNSGWFSFSPFKKQDRNAWISKFLRMHELKDQICSSWFAPVGSASDYPFLSKWVIYGEVCMCLFSILVPVCLSLFKPLQAAIV